MKVWAFLAKTVNLKPASKYPHSTLAVLVRYNQTQKCDLKRFQKVATKYFLKV